MENDRCLYVTRGQHLSNNITYIMYSYIGDPSEVHREWHRDEGGPSPLC